MRVIEPGFLTTVQDLGRRGYQQYGVSVGGAMDPLALRAANWLVGNAAGEAVLEVTLSGPRLQALDRLIVAVTGAEFDLFVDSTPVPGNTALYVREGAVLRFGALRSGVRAYLAIVGGINVPPVLGSRSTDLRGGFGGLRGRALAEGDELPIGGSEFRYDRAGKGLAAEFERYYERSRPIRVIWGPHLDYFDEDSRRGFVEQMFQVSPLSNRMGLRLQGERIARAPGELLSCGVTLGAIQVPQDGLPIILMADHQPTGGYPVLATVIRADIPLLAQKAAGDTIRFTPAEPREARAAWAGLAQMLRQIRD